MTSTVYHMINYVYHMTRTLSHHTHTPHQIPQTLHKLPFSDLPTAQFFFVDQRNEQRLGNELTHKFTSILTPSFVSDSMLLIALYYYMQQNATCASRRKQPPFSCSEVQRSSQVKSSLIAKPIQSTVGGGMVGIQTKLNTHKVKMFKRQLFRNLSQQG